MNDQILYPLWQTYIISMQAIWSSLTMSDSVATIWKCMRHPTPNHRQQGDTSLSVITETTNNFTLRYAVTLFSVFIMGFQQAKKPKLALSSLKSLLFLWVLPLLSVVSPKCVWNLPKFHFIFWLSANQIITGIWSRVELSTLSSSIYAT